MDRILDRGETGPLYLKRPEIAVMVVGAILDGERHFKRYELHAYVVMANHVHLLVAPHVAARRWLGPLKGFTAHEANRILNRTGHFLQDESYDHLVRDGEQFRRIRAYIEANPVKAGVVSQLEEFEWSSAGSRLKAGCSQDWLPHRG
jgi:REP element-mobilizing transposase RayT